MRIVCTARYSLVPFPHVGRRNLPPAKSRLQATNRTGEPGKSSTREVFFSLFFFSFFLPQTIADGRNRLSTVNFDSTAR
ncbi:hypothetical protein BHE74_00010456 [Ensete ventricosum]|nr:hypothetical protein GW17_00055335 [Ensete ventricosum]RWW81176.1 hypothetical protein BHE74_00010456 [Ensete ventricosum]